MSPTVANDQLKWKTGMYFVSCYHGDIPGPDDVDVSHQVLPGQQTLHVHEQGLPHALQLLQVPVQPDGGQMEIITCSFRIIFISGHKNRRANSPSDTVHCVLIGGWNQEADGRHSRLAAFIVQHPPLVGLRVVQQSAFVSSVHRDLRRRNMLTSDRCTESSSADDFKSTDFYQF